MTIREQVKKLREAIKKDEEERLKAVTHANELIALQRREVELKAELETVQSDIVVNIGITFDVSDDMTIAAAKETLAKLEAQIKK